TVTWRTSRMPSAESALPAWAELVSRVSPSNSSVPMDRCSIELAIASAQQPAILDHVDHERPDGERERDSQRGRHEPAVELVPPIGQPAALPTQRLDRVAEREPGQRATDEHVLQCRLDLALAAGGDHHALALGPGAERRHWQLAADQQEADRGRHAAT